MIRNLDTVLLRSFVAVARSGNMTIAADQLGLTQGAVSQQIGRLEDVLQSNLFDRSRRKLKLTPQGERLLSLSKPFLKMNDDILAEMTGQAARGKLRLGIPDDLVTICLPRILPGFVEKHPNVDVELFCSASTVLIDAVERGQLDVAIAEEHADHIRGECLAVERLIWVGGRNGVAYRQRPMPLSIVGEACVFRPVVLEALRSAGVDWRLVFENGNIDATLMTVQTDMAVTTMLASIVPEHLTVLAAGSGLPALPNFSISLFPGAGETSAAAEDLADHIRRAFVGRAAEAA